MNIILSGCGGRMGGEIIRYVSAVQNGDKIISGIDPTKRDFPFPVAQSFMRAESDDGFCMQAKNADVIIDFSSHAATGDILAYSSRHLLPTVICSTGQTEAEMRFIAETSKKVPIFLSANMSTGIALVSELIKTAAKALPECEIEIIERHHDKKDDAPSGTALMLASVIRTVRKEAYAVFGRHGNGRRRKEEIGIHSVRIGGEIGTHEIIFGAYNQTVTVKHEAHSRAMYADGAVRAARFILDKPAGLYGMSDLLNEK